MLSLAKRQCLLLLYQLLSLPILLIGQLNELVLELSLILIKPATHMLQLDVSLAYTSLDLGKGFVLLLETGLIHLIEVDVRHQSITLVTHSVLLLVNFG